MAINPETQYPGKIAPSTPDYPYGAARNITTPGDGTGTPWEAALVNDLFGFQQAILSEAGIVPSGDPDKVGASQYTEALKNVLTGLTYFSRVGLAEINTLDLSKYEYAVFRFLDAASDKLSAVLWKNNSATWTSANQSGRFIDSVGNKFERIDFGPWSALTSAATSEFEIIGHRGLSALYPESTAVALSNSIRWGQADSIEFDIRESSDGVLYCFHDTTLDRVTDGTGPIADATSSYIDSLDAGSYFSSVYAGTRVLRLAEAFSLIRGLNCNIWPQINSNELPAGQQEDQVRRIVQTAQQYGLEGRTYFQCFQMVNIGPFIRKYSKECYLASLLPGDTVANFNASLDYLAGDKKAVILAGFQFWLNNPSLVATARAQGVDVGCYTVNTVETVDALRKIDVLKIMTDINLMGAK
jgi:glycerophosphoryl diester phosphodiesterase